MLTEYKRALLTYLGHTVSNDNINKIEDCDPYMILGDKAYLVMNYGEIAGYMLDNHINFGSYLPLVCDFDDNDFVVMDKIVREEMPLKLRNLINELLYNHISLDSLVMFTKNYPEGVCQLTGAKIHKYDGATLYVIEKLL